MSLTIDSPRTATGTFEAFPAPSRHAGPISRILRRHTIVTADGLDGVLRVADALRVWGKLVKEFAVEVRDGVGYSEVVCTLSATAEEALSFADTLRSLPSVASVEPY